MLVLGAILYDLRVRAPPLKRDHAHADVRRRRAYVQREVVVKHRQGQARKSGARLSKEIVGQSIASVMKEMMSSNPPRAGWPQKLTPLIGVARKDTRGRIWPHYIRRFFLDAAISEAAEFRAQVAISRRAAHEVSM